MRTVHLMRFGANYEQRAWRCKGFPRVELVLFYPAPFYGRFFYNEVIAQLSEKG